jgi:hypothetical protein
MIFSLLGICLGFVIDNIAFSLNKFITLNHFNYFLKLLFILSVILFIIGLLNKKIEHNISIFLKRDLFYVLITSIILVIGFNASMRSIHDNTWFTIGGILPFSDGSDYYIETINWPNKTLSELSSWRPLNPVFNILIFYLGAKTPLGFFLVRIFFLSLVIGTFWHQVKQLIGLPLSIISWILLILWISPFLSTWLTEINGLIFSVAGISSLLGMKNFEDKKSIILGLFLISISNTFRPFNYFLPFLFSIIFLFNNQTSWLNRVLKTVLYGIFFFLIAFLIPRFVYELIGNKNAALNGNSNFSLLGVTRNTNWYEARDFINEKYPNKSNYELIHLMRVEAFETFKSKPKQTITYLYNSLNESYSVFIQKLTVLFLDLKLGSKLSVAISFTILALMLFLTCTLFKTNFILPFICIIGIFGYFSFAPIVFNDGKWRITSTLLVSFSLLIPLSVLGLKKLILYKSNLNTKVNPEYTDINTIQYVPVFIVLTFFASILFTTTIWFYQNPKIRDSSIVLSLSNDEKPIKWINFTTATTQKTAVVNWLNYMANCGYAGFLPLKDYFMQNLPNIEAIKIYNGKYYIVSKPHYQLPELPDASLLDKWAPKFHIE